MDHADYREKYDDPYPDDPLRKWGRMAKQMLDARHVAHDSGTYLGAAASNFRGNKAAGAEVGVTNYGTSWLSSKLALAGQFNSGAENAFVGVNAAVQASTPTRVAPFVGAGVFGGVDLASVINSSDDEETDTQFLGAVYPEAGVHLWLNGRTRLSASASYWVTTIGRDQDFWYYGLGLTFGLGPEPRRSAEGELVREDEYVQRLLDERVRTVNAVDEDLGQPATEEVGESLRDSHSSGHEMPEGRWPSLPDPPAFDRTTDEPLELPMLNGGVLSPARSSSYVEPQN
jgi:hypothetical protein